MLACGVQLCSFHDVGSAFCDKGGMAAHYIMEGDRRAHYSGISIM